MSSLNRIVVTGGAGYLGSHCSAELLSQGREVLVLDNLVNSKLDSIARIEQLTDRSVNFHEVDIRNDEVVADIFCDFRPDAVIHFAGLKSVADSFQDSLEYYDVNVGGLIRLLAAMESSKCNNLIFSSSATVYGNPKYLPCDELHPVCPINPYGRSKLYAESIICDWVTASSERRGVALRYFNPVGAHPSGLLGESPNSTPANLMPILSEVALGKRKHVAIFGDDYPTRDGTGERDYIHVMDLVRGHILALDKLDLLSKYEVINLGTGKASTVYELILEYEKVADKVLATQVEPRRNGDSASCWADITKAEQLLGGKFTRTLEEMCRDEYLWHIKNMKK